MSVRFFEGDKRFVGGTAIEITANKVINLLLRSENNLLHVNDNNELYCDLQLEDGVKVTDTLPVGITVGKILEEDGWEQSGLLMHYKTTSGDEFSWVYGVDEKIYYIASDGVWRTFPTTNDVIDAVKELIHKQQSDWEEENPESLAYINNKPTIPTKTSELENDAGFLTNVDYPSIINNLESTSKTSALSANMGRELKEQIDQFKNVGRFLSIWDATTGLPQTDPVEGLPYNYKTGDYYLIGVVNEEGNNYKPKTGAYDGNASTVLEEDHLAVGDMYFYDGSVWLLQVNHHGGGGGGGSDIVVDEALSTTSKNPVENRVITNRVLGIESDLSTHTGNGTIHVTASDKVAWSQKQNAITDLDDIRAGAALGATSVQPAQLDTKQDKITNLSTIEDNASKGKSAYNTIQGYGNIVTHNASEFQPKLTAGAGIEITANNVINNTAITGNDNVRFWRLDSLSDHTTEIRQYIVDNIDNLKNNCGIILQYNGHIFVGPAEYKTTGSNFYFTDIATNSVAHNAEGFTTLCLDALKLPAGGGNFEYIDNRSTLSNHIAASGASYSSAFIPTEDRQPATKKYVDDALQGDNWVGSSAEYQALTTHEAGKIYFVY